MQTHYVITAIHAQLCSETTRTTWNKNARPTNNRQQCFHCVLPITTSTYQPHGTSNTVPLSSKQDITYPPTNTSPLLTEQFYVQEVCIFKGTQT